MSMEFLMGRTLSNALLNLNVDGPYREAVGELGYSMEKLVDQERDAALGNGGLGRLASCFLDSMATLNLPAWGYGVRYQYGMFRQTLIDGFQHEAPDFWLNFGNPWELERLNVSYPVKFYGHVSVTNENGRQVFKWNPGEVRRIQTRRPGCTGPADLARPSPDLFPSHGAPHTLIAGGDRRRLRQPDPWLQDP